MERKYFDSTRLKATLPDRKQSEGRSRCLECNGYIKGAVRHPRRLYCSVECQKARSKKRAIRAYYLLLKAHNVEPEWIEHLTGIKKPIGYTRLMRVIAEEKTRLAHAEFLRSRCVALGATEADAISIVDLGEAEQWIALREAEAALALL